MSFINSYITVLNCLKQYIELVFTVKVWIIPLMSGMAVNIHTFIVYKYDLHVCFCFYNISLIFFFKDKKVQ